MGAGPGVVRPGRRDLGAPGPPSCRSTTACRPPRRARSSSAPGRPSSLDAGGARRIDGEPADPEIALIVPRAGRAGRRSSCSSTARAIDAAVASSALGARSVRRGPLALLPPARARRGSAGPAPGDPARRAGDDPRRVRRRRGRGGAGLGLHLPRPHDARPARRGGGRPVGVPGDPGRRRPPVAGPARERRTRRRERRRDLRPHGDVRGRRVRRRAAARHRDADRPRGRHRAPRSDADARVPVRRRGRPRRPSPRTDGCGPATRARSTARAASTSWVGSTT